MRIDLHTHSTASDGTDTPAELMANAAAAGLDVVAITDHDTTGGWAPALAARPAGLTVIRGTEFSCVHQVPGQRPVNLHLLGYLFDPTDGPLRREREALRRSRLERGQRIVELLEADGYPVTWPQVSAIAAGGPVGRPHVGRALVASGVVPSVSDAFAGLISSTSKYYVRKVNLDVIEAIRMIRAAGGVTVFAHPLAARRGPIVDDEAIRAMAAAGLDGIEVDHVDHDADARVHARRLADDLGLIPTGSSDYHGTNKTVRLGASTTDPSQYERLIGRARALAPVG